MNRRTWYGSAYLLLSAGILTAGFTSYAAVPEAAQSVVCVQSQTFLEEQNAAFMKEEIGKEISGESEEISGKMMAASVKVLDEKNQQEAEEAREREEKREQERRAALEAAHQQELELLASIIFCEAGNQPYEGQVAVGAVVMNRVNSGLFPDSVEEVVYQSGQFVPAGTGWLDRVRSQKGYTDSAMQAAKDALAGEDPVEGCLYFDQGGSGMQIGAHYFH
nr:cell wall hydrolase [uncultured Merdimonas sp.]